MASGWEGQLCAVYAVFVGFLNRDGSVINLSYNLNKWQLEAGIIMPFGKYDRGSKSLNKWNTNEQHIRLDMRIPYVQISYNLQWGRQKRNTDKLISTGAETDLSSAAGK